MRKYYKEIMFVVMGAVIGATIAVLLILSNNPCADVPVQQIVMAKLRLS